MRDIIQYLERWVGEQPDDPLFRFLDGHGEIVESYSYRALHERSDAMALALADSGRVRFGEPVLLVYPPGLDFIVAFFACAKLGALPVPIQPPDAAGFVGGLEKLAHVMADCGAGSALTNAAYHRQLGAFAERSAEARRRLAEPPLAGLAWIATDLLPLTGGGLRARPHELLFLQYTSGSTQAPRGVMVSHANVVHNGLATLRHKPVALSWLPHYHDMGLIGYYLFIVLRGGTSLWFSGANFMRRPLLWFEAITDFACTITSAPNFAFEYCLREDKVPSRALATLDLRSMRCMMNAAEPVRAGTCEGFRAKFAACGLAPQALVVHYGLAENTLAATVDGRVQLTANARLLEQGHLRIETPRRDSYNQAALVSCGVAPEGVRLRIVEPESRTALSEERIGEIWLAGESKAKGYYNKPELNEALFEARLAGESDGTGYLRTGDMGFLRDGELFVCGRLKDMIISGGRNYYPNDLEAAVERASSKIRAGCVAAFAVPGEAGESIVLLAEATRSNDLPDLEALGAAVSRHCQIELDLLAIVPHGSIVKTSSGKVARQACRQLWLDGKITALARRDRSTRSGDALLEDLLARFDLEECQDLTLAELGVDSFTLIELSLYIEQMMATLGVTEAGAAESLFDLRILQAVTVGEMRAILTEIEETGRVPEAAPRSYRKLARSVEKEELREMRRDAKLPRDIRFAAGSQRRDGKLLLTGATGFLGCHLLDALLRMTDRDILVLARAEDNLHAGARVAAALKRAGLLERALEQGFATRVGTLAADLGQVRLGLPQPAWEEVAAETEALYHCAAEVDYVKPYQALRASNVGGTLEMLRLAAAGPAKPFHLVSTTFMFGFVARETCLETDRNGELAGLNFGYPQSKWVAEQLVFEAARRGLEAAVYRPSFVTASLDGHYVRGDLMARFLAYMIRHAISVDALNQLSLLPANVCADNIVALSLLGAAGAPTYHLTADERYTVEDACRLVTRDFGYRFDYVGIERFIEHMNAHCGKHDPLYPLVAFFNHNWRRIDAMRYKRYDNSFYRRARALSPLTRPEPPLAETIGAITRFLRQESMIPPAPAERPGSGLAPRLRLERSS